EGQLAIVRASELGSIAPHADLSELPLLVDEGALVAHDGGGRGRAALGVTSGGRVILARGDVGASALGASLARAGGAGAVLLARGEPSLAPLRRAATADPPRASYDETTLSAIAVALKPRGFRFEAESTLAQSGR